MPLDKAELIAKIINQLECELTDCLVAADNAHLAATDDQSVAETQYDTLAIEAGYLAEGQAKRALEIKQAIANYRQLTIREYLPEQAIGLGALVQLAGDQASGQWFFIGPAAGGYKIALADGDEHNSITIVTPQSPMAKALIGLYCDDEVLLANRIIDEIERVQ